jgi:hypothetical protein
LNKTLFEFLSIFKKKISKWCSLAACKKDKFAPD